MKKIFWILKYLIINKELSILLLFSICLGAIFSVGLLEMLSSILLIALGQALTSETPRNINFSLPYFDILSFQSLNNLLLFIGLISILVTALKILTLYFQHKLSGKIGSTISSLLTESMLEKKWIVDNSLVQKSEYMATSITHIPNVVGVTNHFLALISSVAIFIGLLSGLLVANTATTLTMIPLLGIFYLLSVKAIKDPLTRLSTRIAGNIKELQQMHSEIYQIRNEIQLLRKIREWTNYSYAKYSILANNQRKSALWAESPRPIIEMLTIIAIILVIMLSAGVGQSLDVIAVLFIIVQKVMPSFQKIFSSYSIAISFQGSIDAIILALDSLNNKRNLYEQSIDQDFFTDHTPLQLDLSFNIDSIGRKIEGNIILEAGEITMLIGPSGAGKSTIANSFLGERRNDKIRCLVRTDSGNFEFSENDIKHFVSLIPQSSHLTTGSIYDNILLNPPIVNDAEKSKEADIDSIILETSLLDSMVETIGNTVISSESGYRNLSGGQIQRIGIARALNTNAKIFIFDEPTSSLDPESSSRIVNNISNLLMNKFILMITHDLSLLEMAKRVYIIDEGVIKEYVNDSDI